MSESTGSGGPASALRPAGRDEVVESTVKAAIQLFSERNPSQVSVRELAARAGVSHALVHRYMGSKHDIFCMALARAREEAAEYWTHEHGLSKTASTFEADLPPGRYVRMVMRASLDGVPMAPEDLKLPHADQMLQMLQAANLPPEESDRGFDVRLLFSAITAMAAGMAVAEQFFLVQSGMQDADHEYVYSELNRLMRRILTLTDTEEPPTR